MKAYTHNSTRCPGGKYPGYLAFNAVEYNPYAKRGFVFSGIEKPFFWPVEAIDCTDVVKYLMNIN